MPPLDELRTMNPGDLIRSDAWNALVTGLIDLQATVRDGLAAVEGAVADVADRVDALDREVTALSARVEPIVRDTYWLALAADKAHFALGEAAVLTGRVTNLSSGLAPEQRPWVDFVTTWGRLHAVAGTDSRIGAAGRSASVQTNVDGVASVRLTAETTAEISDAAAAGIEHLVGRSIGSAQPSTIANVVLNANSPADEHVKAAYAEMTRSYDTSASNVRSFVDHYYRATTTELAGVGRPGFANWHKDRWHDHHVTVMAFAKADSKPDTSDAGLGTNAIQVTFRDWLGPWILLDYLPSAKDLVPHTLERLTPAVGSDFSGAFGRIQTVVRDQLSSLGELGKARQYIVLNNAIDVLDVQDRPFLSDLKQSVKAAVSLQQTVQQAQLSVIGMVQDAAAFEAVANTATRAGSEVGDLDKNVSLLSERVEGVLRQVGDVQVNLGTLGGRLESTLAEGSEFRQLKQQLDVVNDQVNALRGLGQPSEVSRRLEMIRAFDARLEILEKRR